MFNNRGLLMDDLGNNRQSPMAEVVEAFAQFDARIQRITSMAETLQNDRETTATTVESADVLEESQENGNMALTDALKELREDFKKLADLIEVQYVACFQNCLTMMSNWTQFVRELSQTVLNLTNVVRVLSDQVYNLSTTTERLLPFIFERNETSPGQPRTAVLEVPRIEE